MEQKTKAISRISRMQRATRSHPI